MHKFLNSTRYESRRKSIGKEFEKFSKTKDMKRIIKKTDGMISVEEVELLFNLAKDVSSSCIIEVGAYRGRSTVALAYGSMSGNNVAVYSIEPHEDFEGLLGGQFGAKDRKEFYKAMINTSSYKVSRLINLSSEFVVTGWIEKVGLLWIDGDHTFNGVKRDFYCWEPFLTKNARIAFDDSINPEIGPKKLIDLLTSSGKYSVHKKIGKITVLKLK